MFSLKMSMFTTSYIIAKGRDKSNSKSIQPGREFDAISVSKLITHMVLPN